jgi:hypothetical protein
MNYSIVRQVIECERLTDKTDFAVLMVLAYHTDAEGCCRLSTPRLAMEARIGQRTAEVVVERLRAAHYFTLTRGGGKGKSNQYKLHVERGQEVTKCEKATPNPAADAGYKEFESEDTPQQERGIDANNPAGATGYYEQYPANGTGYEEDNPASAAGFRRPNPAADDKPNPAAAAPLYEKYSGCNEVRSTHTAHANAASPDVSPSGRQSGEAVGEGNGDRRPFEIGSDDSRYHSEHFAAVLDACDIKEANVRADPRFCAEVAGIAVTLSENYSTTQIRQIREVWPYETAPTPRQLLREIGRYVNRRPVQQKEQTQNGHQRKPAPGSAGRGIGAVSQFAPGVHFRSRRNLTRTPGEDQ